MCSFYSLRKFNLSAVWDRFSFFKIWTEPKHRCLMSTKTEKTSATHNGMHLMYEQVTTVISRWSSSLHDGNCASMTFVNKIFINRRISCVIWLKFPTQLRQQAFHNSANLRHQTYMKNFLLAMIRLFSCSVFQTANGKKIYANGHWYFWYLFLLNFLELYII